MLQILYVLPDDYLAWLREKENCPPFFYQLCPYAPNLDTFDGFSGAVIDADLPESQQVIDTLVSRKLFPMVISSGSIHIPCCRVLPAPVDQGQLATEFLAYLTERSDVAFDHVDALKWRKHRAIVQEHFWRNLLYGRYVSMDFEALQHIAADFDVTLTKDCRYVPIFLRVFINTSPNKPMDPEHTIYVRDNLIRHQLLNNMPDAPTISINQRLFAVVRRLTPQETLADVEASCLTFSRNCKKILKMNIVCVHKGSMTITELAASSNRLREYMDMVKEPTKRVSAENMVDEIKAYIKANLNRHVSRKELAELVHLNPDHMARLFQKLTHQSLSDYMTQEKMEFACKQLENTDCTISELAAGLGYENISYFSKRFRLHTGILPSAYRRAHSSK